MKRCSRAMSVKMSNFGFISISVSWWLKVHVEEHEVAADSLRSSGHVREAVPIELPFVEFRDFLAVLTRAPAIQMLGEMRELAADLLQLGGRAALGIECPQPVAESKQLRGQISQWPRDVPVQIGHGAAEIRPFPGDALFLIEER